MNTILLRNNPLYFHYVSFQLYLLHEFYLVATICSISHTKKAIVLSFQITQACGKQNNLFSKPYKLYFEFLFSFS